MKQRINHTIGIVMMIVGAAFTAVSANAQPNKVLKAAIVVGRGIEGMSRINPRPINPRPIISPQPIISHKPLKFDSLRIKKPFVHKSIQEALRQPRVSGKTLHSFFTESTPTSQCHEEKIDNMSNENEIITNPN